MNSRLSHSRNGAPWYRSENPNATTFADAVPSNASSMTYLL